MDDPYQNLILKELEIGSLPGGHKAQDLLLPAELPQICTQKDIQPSFLNHELCQKKK